MILALDALVAAWVAVVFGVVFFAIAGRTFVVPDAVPSRMDRVIGHLVRMLLVTVVGGWALAWLGLLNWLTLVLLYAAWPVHRWLRRHRWNPREALASFLSRAGLAVARALDRGGSIAGLRARLDMAVRRALAAAHHALATWVRPREAIVLLPLAVILTLTVVRRFEPPLRELRLGRPENQELLLVTRQVLAGDRPHFAGVPVLPSLAAAVAILGAVDPMQVVRFLPPVLGCLLVLGIGHAARSLSGRVSASLASMLALGAYVFAPGAVAAAVPGRWHETWSVLQASLHESLIRQWAGGGPEVASLLLLLALARWSDACRPPWDAAHAVLLGEAPTPAAFWATRRQAALDSLCALGVVALAVPALVVVAIVAAVVTVARREWALAAVSITWAAVAACAAVPGWLPDSLAQPMLATLPSALALGVGAAFLAAADLLARAARLPAPHVEAGLFIVLLAASVNFLLPGDTRGHYLEHDVAAREALEIRRRHPRLRWTVVAPVEQLAECYGAGWYVDLARFVEENGGRVSDPAYRLPWNVHDTFIFVEKRPFTAFDSEPQAVPFTVLADPTYRHYRSPAGRASLEYAALALCEAYRGAHSDMSVVFEDDVLRVYRVATRQ